MHMPFLINWSYTFLCIDKLISSVKLHFFQLIVCYENYSLLDCPAEWQFGFQDPATPVMEGIIHFHNHIMIVICAIVFFVGWFMFNCISYYSEHFISKSTTFTHSTELEIVWTTVPAIILLILAMPSFTLLYSMDEVLEPVINFKIIGHQWYWGYELSDYVTCINGDHNIQYDCYMMALDGLPENRKGYFRLLETNRRVLFPIKTHLRLYITAADVLHSWTIPSFGLKVDACPGRLNLVNLFIKRVGLFFGQCSEICGVNHGFMPIALMGIDISQYNSYLLSKIDYTQ